MNGLRRGSLREKNVEMNDVGEKGDVSQTLKKVHPRLRVDLKFPHSSLEQNNISRFFSPLFLAEREKISVEHFRLSNREKGHVTVLAEFLSPQPLVFPSL